MDLKIERKNYEYFNEKFFGAALFESGDNLPDVFGVWLFVLPAQAQLTLTVTRTDDRNAACVSGVDCSLREAISAANTAASNDTINFSIAGCPGGVCTITLTGELTAAAAGTLTISNTTGAANLLISGNNANRVFRINPAADLTLNGLTITRGSATGVQSFGGGIYNNGGTVTITNSHITNNTASSIGAGILNDSTGTLNVISSTISNNTVASTQGSSGGIDNSGTVTVVNSTISGNRANGGGSGNDRSGGGIDSNNGTVTVTDSTITDNEVNNTSGTSAGGIYYRAGTLTVRNSIIAGNCARTTAPLCSSTTADVTSSAGLTFTSQGFNLIGSAPAGIGFTNGAMSDQVGNSTTQINPLLSALANNGGNTPTHALQTGSPAIDKGNNFGVNTDQRGLARPFDNPAVANATGGDGSDIGSFELQAGPTAAAVTLGGRLVTTSRRGLSNAYVNLTGADGTSRTVLTNPFGYFRFPDVAAGETYILTVFSKRYRFAPQIVNPKEDLDDLMFVAEP